MKNIYFHKPICLVGETDQRSRKRMKYRRKSFCPGWMPGQFFFERLNREIKRRTKAIGAFPDGQSALMLVCARLCHVAATSWGARRYMNMDHLFKSEEDLLSDIIAG